ncbi:MAG TPA: hypothetical protein VIY48_09945 [Candidatus Paceibacterota bacterium]
MCRLAAVVPIDQTKRGVAIVPQALTMMMLENSRLSNKDGYGIGIPVTGETYKEMTAATVGLPTVDAIQWIWKTYKAGQILMGHTRLSTTGKGRNEPRNAHPFTVGPWMLAHNGHFSNWEDLHKEMGLGQEIVVDSEVALHSLARTWGDAKTLTLDLIKAGLDELEGSYALIVGNQNEPNRLYLIVGSNPLNVYSNDRLFMVNTDNQLQSFIDQSMWVAGLGYGWWQPVTKTELKHNMAYVLDRTEGVTELGSFVPKVAVRAATTYYQPYQKPVGATNQPTVITPATTSSPKVGDGSVGADNADRKTNQRDTTDIGSVNLVNPAQAAQTVARLNTFLGKVGVTLSELEEMLVELPTVVPAKVWDLTNTDLSILEAWFAHLETLPEFVFKSNLMPSRRAVWLKYKETVGKDADPYMQAVAVNSTFRVPYYLNSVETIGRLIVGE